MNFNIDQLKKKIIYRSNYRGTKEMDKLLSAFTKKYINELENNDLVNLLRSGRQSPVKVTFNNVRSLQDVSSKLSEYLCSFLYLVF